MIISKAFDMYENDKRLMGYSPHTMKAYKIQRNLLIRYFGDIDIEEITYEKLKAYLAKDINRLKPSSIGHRIRFIKSFYRWALDEGHVNNNPASRLKEPKSGKRIPKYLNEEEIELLREACRTPLERSLIELLFATGSRIGEIQKLNKSDIDFVNESIIVNGKGNKQREVYFKTKCSFWLKRYIISRDDNCEALFVTERKQNGEHKRMSIAQLRYVIKRIAKRSEVTTNVFPHAFRHSFAMNLLRNGADFEVIRDLMGHERSDVTRIYASLTGEMRREMYRKYS